jgi:hypothetical protein
MTNRAVPAVMTELRTINAMINSTKTMLIVSAVYCHARPESNKKSQRQKYDFKLADELFDCLPRAKMRAMKIDKLWVESQRLRSETYILRQKCKHKSKNTIQFLTRRYYSCTLLPPELIEKLSWSCESFSRRRTCWQRLRSHSTLVEQEQN